MMLLPITATVAIRMAGMGGARLAATQVPVIRFVSGQPAYYQATPMLLWPDRMDQRALPPKPCGSWMIRRRNCSLDQRYRLRSVISGIGATMVV